MHTTITPAPQLPADPNLASEQAKAQADQVKALQVEAQGDTASIMARYGARLALAGTSPQSSNMPLAGPTGFR